MSANSIRIVKSITEPSPQTGNVHMSLYFEGAPTVKQIKSTVGQLAMAHVTRPNMKSPNLKFHLRTFGDLVRCQVID